MVDILLSDGDLVVDKYGDIMICNGEDADVSQTANNSIMLKFGGNKFHDSLGNKVYNKRIKLNNSGINTIRSECISAILNGDSRVQEVKHIVVTMPDKTILDSKNEITSITIDGTTYEVVDDSSRDAVKNSGIDNMLDDSVSQYEKLDTFTINNTEYDIADKECRDNTLRDISEDEAYELTIGDVLYSIVDSKCNMALKNVVSDKIIIDYVVTYARDIGDDEYELVDVDGRSYINILM